MRNASRHCAPAGRSGQTAHAWALIVVGITGAIENQTPIGTLVLPELVVNGTDGSQHRPTPLGLGDADGKMWTTDELVLDPTVHAALRARGVVALDMETAARRGGVRKAGRALVGGACDQ